ncbi:MAG TPA: hypothetical protein VH969_15480 [Actinophytocola sp.]|jgi:hypothetical protein|uniref:hypothetical protein n=1 Tax=Actinophytocola sp. TaxID=1872138 RepID=UPI002F94B131
MTEPTEPEKDAEAQTQRDPVLFGADPFARQPGEPQPDERRDTELPRPRWPVVVGILVVVVVLVGALGIWVL